MWKLGIRKCKNFLTGKCRTKIKTQILHPFFLSMNTRKTFYIKDFTVLDFCVGQNYPSTFPVCKSISVYSSFIINCTINYNSLSWIVLSKIFIKNSVQFSFHYIIKTNFYAGRDLMLYMLIYLKRLSKICQNILWVYHWTQPTEAME